MRRRIAGGSVTSEPPGHVSAHSIGEFWSRKRNSQELAGLAVATRFPAPGRGELLHLRLRAVPTLEQQPGCHLQAFAWRTQICLVMRASRPRITRQTTSTHQPPRSGILAQAIDADLAREATIPVTAEIGWFATGLERLTVQGAQAAGFVRVATGPRAAAALIRITAAPITADRRTAVPAAAVRTTAITVLRAGLAVIATSSEAGAVTIPVAIAVLLLIAAFLVPPLPPVLPRAAPQALVRLLRPDIERGERAAQPQACQGSEHLPTRGPRAYGLGDPVKLRSIHAHTFPARSVQTR